MTEHRMLIGTDLELLIAAAKVAVTTDRVSPALIQRRVRVGFVKSARLALLLSQEGITGDQDRRGMYPVMLKPEGLDAAVERLKSAAAGEDT